VLIGAMVAAMWIKLLVFQVALHRAWEPLAPASLWSVLSAEFVAVTLLSLLLLVLPLLWISGSYRFAATLVLSFGVTTVVLFSLVHVDFYGEPVSLWNGAAARNVIHVLPSVMALTKPVYALLYADVLIAFVVWRFRRLDPIQASVAARGVVVRRLVLWGGGAALVAAVPVMSGFAPAESGLLSPVWQRGVVARFGLLGYHKWDLASFAMYSSVRPLSPAEQARAGAFLARERTRGPASPLAGVAAGRNVIVISAESFQSYLVGLHVHGRQITPNLSALVRESLYFENVFDQTHLGTTSDGEFLALQSLHPSPAGVVAFNYRRNTFHGLPAILLGHGYATVSAVAAPGDFWNMSGMHARYGIQRSYFEDSFTIGERIGPWMGDREFFPQAADRLREHPEPFFAFLLSASHHHPFKLPADRYVLDLGPLEGTPLGDYLHTAHYFDAALGEFVEGLRSDGLLDRSMFVVYGDHRGGPGFIPELAELLGYDHEDTFRHLQTRMRVPLIIRLPNGAHAGPRAVVGGQIDIAPTLLSLLGVEDPSRVMLGQDLTSGQHSLVVFRDGGFVDGEHYVLTRFGGFDSATCYSTATGQGVPCAGLAGKHREALERLQVSDLILQGDLIPRLREVGLAGADAGTPPGNPGGRAP
jgi:lipoteichoic acid synthase